MMLFGLNNLDEEISVYSSSFTVALLSNSLAMAGLSYYFFLTFRGYGILPFVRKPQKYLLPVPALGVLLSLMTLFGVNAWNVLLKFTII